MCGLRCSSANTPVKRRLLLLSSHGLLGGMDGLLLLLLVLLHRRDARTTRGRFISRGRTASGVRSATGRRRRSNGAVGRGGRGVCDLRVFVFVSVCRLLRNDWTRDGRCLSAGDNVDGAWRGARWSGCWTSWYERAIRLWRSRPRRRETAGNRRWRTGVLEAVFAIAWEPWTLRGAHKRLRSTVGGVRVRLLRLLLLLLLLLLVGAVSLRVGGTHLVPHGIILALFCVVLVEVDHVDGGLGVLLLFLLCDAVAGQHALPFLGETLGQLELA